MQNPTLEFTILNPKHLSKTIYENRILDEYKWQLNWSEFVQFIKGSKELIEEKEQHPLIIPVTWKTKNFIPVTDKAGQNKLIDGEPVPRRCKDNIQDWYMLPIDVDECLSISAAKEHFKAFTHLGYTTYNHSPKKNKFRILIPLLKPISNEEFLKRTDAIKDFI